MIEARSNIFSDEKTFQRILGEYRNLKWITLFFKPILKAHTIACAQRSEGGKVRNEVVKKIVGSD